MRVALIAIVLGSQVAEPVFDSELPPGEGLPVFAVAGDSLILRSAPSGTAAVRHSVHVTAGLRFESVASRYRTVRSGLYVSTEAALLAGRGFDTTRFLTRVAYYSHRPEYNVPIAAGDTIEFLQHRAEGACFVRLNGAVSEAARCPDFRGPGYRKLRDPLVEWWVEIVAPRGERGWVRVGSDGVKVVDRRG